MKVKSKKINIDKLYQDQCLETGNLGGLLVYNILLPRGIKKLDQRFTNRILAFGRNEIFTDYAYNYSFSPPKQEVEMVYDDTYEGLKKEITSDSHLHPIIKENLLFNLKNSNKLRKTEQ